MTKMTKISAKDLPQEADEMLKWIKKGHPYPFPKDGTEFMNYERLLPIKESNYYMEFTVPTPNVTQRGATRSGAGKSGEIYYTDDHDQTCKEVIR